MATATATAERTVHRRKHGKPSGLTATYTIEGGVVTHSSGMPVPFYLIADEMRRLAAGDEDAYDEITVEYK